MAISNKERVGRGLEQVRLALRPFVETEMRGVLGDSWHDSIPDDAGVRFENGEPLFDTQALLKIVINGWDGIFGRRFNRDVLNLAHDVRKARNKFAHDDPFETDDAFAALHEMQQLLESVSAGKEAEEVEKLKMDLLRQRFEDQARREQRKATTVAIEGTVLGGLKPWREVIAPHEDVARGTYQQAEFAADLWQVYKGEGTAEYRDPREFFGRTFLTDGLRELLVNALKRLSGQGGDPVVELQINFGGGKTHSMLALYHLFSGAKAADLPGVEAVLTETGITQPPPVKRAVLVGNSLKATGSVKEDGTTVHTLWGELAWQLGGRSAYDLVRESDETATNPGDALDAIFKQCGAALILIDEWVAYARQLWGREKMLPAGSFDTQFTFAQTLCEAARRAPNVLVLVSIPASVSEQGDEGGRNALSSLKQAVGRSNLVWRPATSDESFEIVRRRLFQTVHDPAHRDAVIRAFMELYRSNAQDFPSECKESDYERRLRAAYPIHPELFDRLYNDWSTLEKFQRTRGVLRLMAAVIHSLWERGDKSVLILPATVPIDDPSVQPELTRYLEERWSAVVDRDVDGPHAVPIELDNEFSNFGRYSACRRVARTVFLGSAPTLRAANQGIEDKRIKLGCAQPGESVPTFGDAMRKLSDGRTTYLYVSGTRYWYDTQASVNKLARDLAERDDIKNQTPFEIGKRLKASAKTRGDFHGVHVAPGSHEVPNDRNLRLVILGPDHPHKQGNMASAAVVEATDILKTHGTAHRDYRNRLVFLACDQTRAGELGQAVRMYLAWSYLVEKAEELNLDPNNQRQAQTKVTEYNQVVEQRVQEVYQWALAPTQPPIGSDADVIARWEDFRVQGADPLAVRVGKKLKNEQVLTADLGGNVLKHEIDKVPLWRGDQVSVTQLEDDFCKYLYLPRLVSLTALHAAIRDGVSRIIDGFGYADAYNEAEGAYENLRVGVVLDGSRSLTGVLVKGDVADAYLTAQRQAQDAAAVTTATPPSDDTGDDGFTLTPPGNGATHTGSQGMAVAPRPSPAQGTVKPTRFHGTVKLDPRTVSTGAGQVSKEVVQHLLSLLGSEVEIVVEIHAKNGNGFGEGLVRTISENCRTLKFDSHGFEEE
jgi:hypothetical protein